MDSLYIGVDVGSGSVRAGLFTASGDLQHVAVKEIRINNPEPGYYEQSSDEIWNAVAYTVKEVTKNVDEEKIASISFCATCSLVAIGETNKPVSINKDDDSSEWNIVMWMDHRAHDEADFINSTGHNVLQYVGGSISLEMETPKLLWLKKNLPSRYNNTRHFFDLGDFLRWKATGSLRRSVCCLGCKWTFVNSPTGSSWDESYFREIGIEDVLPKIGVTISFPGDTDQISLDAAATLGLSRFTKVGFSMIDAHSGVLGMLGCHNQEDLDSGLTDAAERLSIICGTSNCHMALNRKSMLVPGVWGPYYGVILNDFYLSEGGQSAAGKLLDHVVMSHTAYPALLEAVGSHGKVLSKLEGLLSTIAANQNEIATLTSDLHIWPDFHGNRSPLANPTLKGMVSGLTLSTSVEDLAVVYLATIQALAYGSRHIKDVMEKAGHKFTELVLCGGLIKSKLFVQMHADILDLPVVIPACTEPVLLGAAMSAAAAASSDLTLIDVVARMAGGCTKVQPRREDKTYHDKKYQVFLKMVEDQVQYRKIMSD
ncbi:unnamed protein product [Allacma fusca]|uniref:FGGY carbohydrate kinase domain-containing protein n=1 Tax=Allacma fusca TaxID=39272 RepID=A0A8J2NMY2_9HEXA|nr:unnamed protein product [Allacma fusca]